MKPLIIYHDNCADGFGAAFAAWLKFGDDADYLPMQYNQPLDPSKVQYEDRDVYILDFSFPKETMEKLLSAASHLVWLDHHKTAFEMWCGGIPDSEHYIRCDDKRQIFLVNFKSGAMLAWEHFHPGTLVPYLIQLIDDRDRWVFQYGEESRALHAALSLRRPWTFKDWAALLPREVLPNEPNETHAGVLAIAEGRTILRYQAQQVEESAKRALPCCIPWSDTLTPRAASEGMAVNTPNNISEVGHALAKQSGTYGLVWYYDAKDKVAQCSLRSIGDYDVSAIAKAFGGGGHQNAAGFRVSVPRLLEWLKG